MTSVLIQFDIVPCSAGFLLVAATPNGLCSVRLGDAPEPLEATLREEFPDAILQPDAVHLADWIAAISRQLEGEEARIELPLDVRATEFQRRVWRELQTIPAGETRTYSQIAHAIGNPKAVRAVGRACATNPIAVVIPCHRVVRQDRAASGYRWTLERKQNLLDKERPRAESQASLFLAP